MKLTNIVVTLFAATCVCSAQLQSSSNRRPEPDMDERALEEKYHIAPTKEGLLAALHHAVPAVRSFAAFKLSNDRQMDAVAPILAALAAETIPGVKIILATSATRLGSDEGAEA